MIELTAVSKGEELRPEEKEQIRVYSFNLVFSTWSSLMKIILEYLTDMVEAITEVFAAVVA